MRLIAIGVGQFAERLLSREVGLSVSDSRVLSAIAAVPDSTATEVSVRISMTPVQVGRCVAKLKSAGLVQASSDVNDARASRLSLTLKGREVETFANEIADAVQHWAIRDLSPEEWKVLDGFLDRLLKSSKYTEVDAVNLMALVCRPLADRRNSA